MTTVYIVSYREDPDYPIYRILGAFSSLTLVWDFIKRQVAAHAEYNDENDWEWAGYEVFLKNDYNISFEIMPTTLDEGVDL